MTRIFLTLILIVAALLPGRAYVQSRSVAADSLYKMLGRMKTPADSLMVLTNLYDVLPRAKSSEVGWKVMDVAHRANNPGVALDIIRNQANRFMRNDSLLQVLVAETQKWPVSEDRAETLTFIKMMDNMRRGKYGDKETRKQFLKELLGQITDTDEGDIYRRIGILHGVCMLVTVDTDSELLSSYMDSLESLVNRLPPTAYSIRNAFNIHAALAYAGVDPKKSVETDQRTIANVSRLAKYYTEKGRRYRDYSATFYTIYTRMLSNFESLAPNQVEDYYKKVLYYVDRDPASMATYKKFPAAEIYYALYNKDWAKAKDLILKSDVSAIHNRQMTRYLIQCADSVGDRNTLLTASREYNRLLENELHERSRGTLRELQIAYSIYDMRHHLGKIERQRVKSLSRIQRWVIVGSSVVLVVLVALVILLMRNSRRNRLLAARLTESNAQLRAESESLRVSREESLRARSQAEKANNLKSDFIKNMSYEVKVPLQAITEYSRLIADCADSTGIKHITRFADMLELNTELLSTIIGDVLRLSEIEAATLPIHQQVVNLQSLCSATVEAIQHRVKPGVTMQLAPDAPKLDLFTDPTRVQQILNNLLVNAAKFTSKGSITLDYRNCPDKGVVEFSVTDTGIGINPDNREKIFDRFVKLDRDTQGAGLGLTISRLLARYLGGDLILDVSYPGPGSRFVLTLPKR